MDKQRRSFSAEEKLKAVRRHLVEKETVSSICNELQVQPSVFYEWQKALFEKGASVFNSAGRPAPTRERELAEKVAKLEAKLARKDNPAAGESDTPEATDETGTTESAVQEG